MSVIDGDGTTPVAPRRRPTIRDVAATAGVSVSAASKVLRDAYGVSPAMRERVQAAMDALGYRPFTAARGMRGKTYTVGVVVSDIQNSFYGLVADGLSAGFRAAGYELLIGPAGADSDAQAAMIEAMLDRRMDGLVLISPVGLEGRLEEVGREVPLVVVGRQTASDAFDSVSSDDIAGSGLIVDHLVALGHRRISLVTHASASDEPRLAERVRAEGYVRAMRRHGLEEHVDIVPTTWTHEGGRRAAQLLLQRDRLPTGVHAGADVAALGLLDALWERGISVPDELSVAGYDNSPTSALAPVSLTTVDQSAVVLGETAGRLLLERIGGRTSPVSVLLAPRLVARGTTGPCPAG